MKGWVGGCPIRTKILCLECYKKCWYCVEHRRDSPWLTPMARLRSPYCTIYILIFNPTVFCVLFYCVLQCLQTISATAAVSSHSPKARRLGQLMTLKLSIGVTRVWTQWSVDAMAVTILCDSLVIDWQFVRVHRVKAFWQRWLSWLLLSNSYKKCWVILDLA